MDFFESEDYKKHYRHPLIQHVLECDLENVKLLINADRSILNDTVLFPIALIISPNGHDMVIFDYLLQCLEETNPEQPLAILGEDILFRVTSAQADYLSYWPRSTPPNLGYPITKLIDKGADVNFRDKRGNTLLHIGGRHLPETVAVAAITKGADVNATNDEGETPLFSACTFNSVEWVQVLLYYGAIATIPNFDGILPLDVPYNIFSHNARKKGKYLSDRYRIRSLLLYHTIDEGSEKIDLSALVCSMYFGASDVEEVSEVVYDEDGLEFFHEHLPWMDTDCLAIFIKKFRHIFEEYLKIYSPFDKGIFGRGHVWLDWCSNDLIFFLLKSEVVPELMENTKFPTLPLIPYLGKRVSRKVEKHISMEDFTKTVCELLSYGLDPTTNDLIYVYEKFGYCELFQILLHMEILDSPDSSSDSIACLYYDFERDLETLLESTNITTTLLSFFHHPKLRERYINLEEFYNCTDSDKSPSEDDSDDSDSCWRPWQENKKVMKILKSLPSVPLLTELSRNVARKFIVNKYNIKKSVQFYTVLNLLPIDRFTKSILTLETKLY